MLFYFVLFICLFWGLAGRMALAWIFRGRGETNGGKHGVAFSLRLVGAEGLHNFPCPGRWFTMSVCN